MLAADRVKKRSCAVTVKTEQKRVDLVNIRIFFENCKNMETILACSEGKLCSGKKCDANFAGFVTNRNEPVSPNSIIISQTPHLYFGFAQLLNVSFDNFLFCRGLLRIPSLRVTKPLYAR